jgi:hypothetical protein
VRVLVCLPQRVLGELQVLRVLLEVLRRLLLRLVLLEVLELTCFPNRLLHALMNDFWLPILLRSCVVLMLPLMQAQSTRHCHMLVWQVFHFDALVVHLKVGQHTHVPLNFWHQHKPALFSDFTMVPTDLPVFFEIELITVPHGVPLLIPDLNDDANGEVTFLNDVMDVLRNLRGISDLQRCRMSAPASPNAGACVANADPAWRC